MTTIGSNEQRLLDSVGFAASELPHPVDLLTVEMAAEAAGLPATTVASAVASADDFRDLTLQAAIRLLETTPNDDVWTAMQQTVVRSVADRSLSDVLGARAQQLADDPGFPLLLSGFERLDELGTASAVNDTLRSLVLEMWPFIQTVRSAAGQSVPPDPTEEVLFGSLLCLLGESIRRLLAPTDSPEADAVFSELLATLLTGVIDAEPRPTAPGSLLPETTTLHRRSVNGLAVDAVNGGAQLLLGSAIGPATSLTVAEAATRCGLSTAHFYRVFGSMGEFENQLIRQVGGSLADSFAEHFFHDDLERIESSEENRPDSRAVFATYYSQTVDLHRHHAETRRQGVELLPWLNSSLLGPLVTRSYQDRFGKRGEFFARFMSSLDLQPVGGLSAIALASFMGVASIAIEFLLRNAPDRDETDAYLLEHSLQFLGQVFVPKAM